MAFSPQKKHSTTDVLTRLMDLQHGHYLHSHKFCLGHASFFFSSRMVNINTPLAILPLAVLLHLKKGHLVHYANMKKLRFEPTFPHVWYLNHTTQNFSRTHQNCFGGVCGCSIDAGFKDNSLTCIKINFKMLEICTKDLYCTHQKLCSNFFRVYSYI